MEYDAIPEDAECIIIHAPEKDFSEDDANKVIEYLNNGGKALITTEYVDTQMPNFEKILWTDNPEWLRSRYQCR